MFPAIPTTEIHKLLHHHSVEGAADHWSESTPITFEPPSCTTMSVTVTGPPLLENPQFILCPANHPLSSTLPHILTFCREACVET